VRARACACSVNFSRWNSFSFTLLRPTQNCEIAPGSSCCVDSTMQSVVCEEPHLLEQSLCILGILNTCHLRQVSLPKSLIQGIRTSGSTCGTFLWKPSSLR
jgi:hypothetical protein